MMWLIAGCALGVFAVLTYQAWKKGPNMGHALGAFIGLLLFLLALQAFGAL